MSGWKYFLETICLKCLEKDPDGRYASACELADELRRFLAGDEIRARPISHTERLWRWCRRNPRIPMLSAALLLVALIAYAAAWLWLDRQMDRTDRVLTERALENVHFTALSVAESAGRDFEQYFDLVEDAASQPELIECLRAMQSDPEMRELTRQLSEPARHERNDDETNSLRKLLETNPLRAATQKWIEQFGDDLPVFASFVLLADGLQIARHPEEGGQTIGRNYAWRAYYSGHAQDEAKTWRPDRPDNHVHRTHLSPPFVSEFTDEWVIVISTPVFDSRNNQDRFLGVMGLMVRLGSFAKLPGNKRTAAAGESDSSFAVLVDTREAHQGQILQHPLLGELDDRRPAAGAPSPRRQLLDRSQQDGSLRVAIANAPQTAHYRDPFGFAGPKYDRRWLASRLPVTIRDADCGLAVIVQESYDQLIGQPLAQMRHGLILLSLITLGLSAAAIIPLWGVILRLVR